MNENETWVTASEWMQGPKGLIPPDNPWKADNSVYVARIRWNAPNRDWNGR